MPLTDYGPGDEITWGPCTDPRDPRWDDSIDPPLAEWEADEQAADEISSTAANVAEWLYTVTDHEDGWKPVETMKIADAALQDAPVHILLAVVMTGTDRQANLARMFLRDRYQAARADQIGERASELLLETNGPEHGYDDDF